MLINKVFKINLNSSFNKELEKYLYKINPEDGANYFNFGERVRAIEGLRLLLPWNKFTYPFLCVLIAYHETKNLKWFFKLIFEHLIWSLKWSFKDFNKVELPEEH